MSPLTPASYDLHLHTCWSYDATADAERYFQQATTLGLRCLAITEHHNIDSLEEVLEIARGYPEIKVIPAAELTVTSSIGAVDLLCYNLPRQPTGALAEVLDEYRRWQQSMGAWRSDGMQALGYDYTEAARLELLRTYRPERVLARQGATHVKGGLERQHFFDRGYVKTLEEFGLLAERFRRAGRPGQRPLYPAVERVVPAVKAAGGTVVIAHPAGYFQGTNRARMDALREECRLDGIECAHRTVLPELTAFYRAYCREHGLVSTAGSDSHDNQDIVPPAGHPWGHTKERCFASHIGSDEWLDEFLERIDG